MRLDLFDLQLFTATAESGSITAGARRLHIALAAASSRLQRLEQHLGAALLIRENRGVRLTVAGQTLLHHATSVIQQVNRLREEVSGFGTGLKGHLRILANTTAINATLPSAMGAFLAEHLQVTVDLEERLSHEIVRAVADGHADLGLVAGDVPTSGLRMIPYRDDALVAVVNRGHRFARRRRIAFAELLDGEFVGLDEASAINAFLIEAAAREGRSMRVRVRLRSFDGVCRMVEANVGVAVIPASIAQRTARDRGLNVLPLRDAWARRNLRICVRAGEELSPLTQRLINHLRAAA